MPRPLNHVEAGESGLCEKLGRGLNEALVRVGNVRAAQGRLDSERKRLVCAYVCGYMRVYATMCVWSSTPRRREKWGGREKMKGRSQREGTRGRGRGRVREDKKGERDGNEERGEGIGGGMW